MDIKKSSRYGYSAIILKQLVITDFKLRYKGSALGYLWTLLKPLALFGVMYLVFVRFLKFGADVPHFAVALLLGTIMWNYFVEVSSNGMLSIVGKGDMLRKLSFPRYVIVLAGSFSALINLAINLVVVVIFILLNGVEVTARGLLIIPLIAELFIFSLGVAFLLSALYVKLRDINYIWELALQVGFYATPIFYPIAMVAKAYPPAAELIMTVNPLAQIIQDARFSLISADTPTVWTLVPLPLALLPILLTFIIAVIAVTYFKKASPHFAEEI